MHDKPTFGELYESVKKRHSSILQLDADTIQRIEDELEKAKRTKNTFLWMASTLAVLFSIATYPFLLAKAYSFVVAWQKQLSAILYQRQFLDRHWVVWISSFLIFFAVPLLTIGFRTRVFRRLHEHPTLGLPFRLAGPENPVENIDGSKLEFIVYTVILHYILPLIPLLYCYSYRLLSKPILDSFIVLWLMAPMLLLASLPSILFLILLAVALVFIFKIDNLPSEKTPTTLIFYLVKLLHTLEELEELPISNNRTRSRLVNSIMRISNLMRRMYRDIAYSCGISQWSIQQMDQAADNFLSLAAWVYFPQPNTLENLRGRLCKYLNTFISGHYHDLPREEVSQFDVPSIAHQKRLGLRQFVTLLSLAAYMVLPVVAMATTVALFKIEIPSLLQPLLTIMYIIWVVLGLLSFADSLSPDVKDFLAEIVRSVVGRK